MNTPQRNIPRSANDNYSNDVVKERVTWLGEKTHCEFKHINHYSFAPAEAKGNVENFIGVAQVPVGLAGPITLNGQHAIGDFYIPMATTEGALIASYNRGMKIISESGGATTRILKDQTHIGAALTFNSITEVISACDWINTHFDELKQAAEETTHHGKLISIETRPQGNRLLLNFAFTTGDASGLNMITIGTKAAMEHIGHKLGKNRYLLPVTFHDKKATSMNVINGRGKKIVADVLIPSHVVTSLMRCTAKEAAQAAAMHNSLATGNGGTASCNHHFANGLAAIFIACGQDVAYVAESSVGVTTMEETEDGDLYASVTLPDLIVATVGGGTSLGTAKECLQMMGCHGNGKAKKFAEITAATLLAGEISMWGAIVSGEFSAAHDKHGRNRPG